MARLASARVALSVAASSMTVVLAACGSGTAQPADLLGDAGFTADAADGATSGPCPAALASFKPAMKPPMGATKGQCTDPAITQITSACFGPQKTGKACEESKAANPTCASCMFYGESAAAWGPVVTLASYGGAVALNYPGCIALLDGQSGAGSCAAKANEFALCPLARCAGCSASARPACIATALDDPSPCRALQKPFVDCLAAEALPQAEFEQKCGVVTPSVSAEEWATRLAKTFCG